MPLGRVALAGPQTAEARHGGSPPAGRRDTASAPLGKPRRPSKPPSVRSSVSLPSPRGQCGAAPQEPNRSPGDWLSWLRSLEEQPKAGPPQGTHSWHPCSRHPCSRHQQVPLLEVPSVISDNRLLWAPLGPPTPASRPPAEPPKPWACHSSRATWAPTSQPPPLLSLFSVS